MSRSVVRFNNGAPSFLLQAGDGLAELRAGDSISSASAAAVKAGELDYFDASRMSAMFLSAVRFCICVDSGNKSHAAVPDDPGPAPRLNA